MFSLALVLTQAVAHAEETPMVQNGTVRIQAVKRETGYVLQCQVRKPGAEWRTVLSQVVAYTSAAWEEDKAALEDLQIAPGRDANNQPFFTKTDVADDHQTLILRGKRDVHHVEQRITLAGDGQVQVAVRDTLASSTAVERLMSHFYFTPDGRSKGYALPMDFAWLPSLHRTAAGISGDYTFRSPAAIVVARGLYAAIVPDLNLLAANRDVPHALDLRCWEHPGAGAYGLPRLSYGLCPWKGGGHVFMVPGPAVKVSSKQMTYGFDLLLGEAEDGADVARRTTQLLWKKYGSAAFKDIRPQVLPFEQYGRKYAYVYQLKKEALSVELDGRQCWGINNAFRHGANFHAWENDVHVGFGLWYYGDKWNRADLRRMASGMMELSLAAPRKEGAFPCIFNFNSKAWEGTLYWTAEPAWARDGYDTASMGTTAWWQLYWAETFKTIPQAARAEKSAVDLAGFLARVQLASGAIPTYYDVQLRPCPQLKESATTAIGGAVLAKAALITGNPTLKKAALEAGRFMDREILPKTLFQDFEVFYSCAPLPLHWLDPVNGIPPVNNLAIQWSADQFLALYRLTGDTHWLASGEYCLSILSLFQQVWSPPYLTPPYLFGGFGAQNHDGEWNDLRSTRFVSTYADYYKATGNVEYLERAVAACRASFAGMDTEENHANCINQYHQSPGYSAENQYHGGNETFEPVLHGDDTGFNWSAGGALSASAYLEKHFGSVWVDGQLKRAVPIDGVKAEIVFWEGQKISLRVESALTKLPHPYVEPRRLVVKFGRLAQRHCTITINGKDYGVLNQEQLESGVTFSTDSSR